MLHWTEPMAKWGIVSEKVAFFIVAVFWLIDLPGQGVVGVMHEGKHACFEGMV